MNAAMGTPPPPGRLHGAAGGGLPAGRSTGAGRAVRQRAIGRSDVVGEGALPEKTKELVAVAVAHTTQCPYCIRGHTRLAERKGASPEEIMEAIWVAAEMRAGGAYAHATLALETLDHGHRPDH